MVVEPTPNTALGQHWLRDIPSLQAIIAAAGVSSQDTVLEVGPGLGTLTKELLHTGAHVIAVEYDTDLANQLPKRLPHQNLTVIQHDILSFNLTTLPKNYSVVANIPYYLTSKLVRTVCESTNPPIKTVLLVQKEVAQRIAAQPGAMSILSVSAQVYNTVTLGIEVPAELFTPPPKVDSQVVILERRAQPLVPTDYLADYFRVIKAGFSERRKKLRSSLSGGLHIDKQVADTLLAQANIPNAARAQELSLDDWLRLTDKYRLLMAQ